MKEISLGASKLRRRKKRLSEDYQDTKIRQKSYLNDYSEGVPWELGSLTSLSRHGLNCFHILESGQILKTEVG